jgi:hypothetical protein
MLRDLKWSPAEKKIAREAYDVALESALGKSSRSSKEGPLSEDKHEIIRSLLAGASPRGGL